VTGGGGASLKSVWKWAVCVLFAWAWLAQGDDLTITSFKADGTIGWACSTGAVAEYRVEGSGSIESGQWTNDLAGIAPTGATMSAVVPIVDSSRFFRVVAVTNAAPPAPEGMALIPAGSFQMGNCTPADGDGADELPLHTVYVSAFYMDEHEVTKAQWDEVYAWATTNGYAFDNAGSGKAADHPVHTVNWYDCVKWCNARSQKEGLTPCYNLSDWSCNWAANGYRLPTEAEWEKAARGGTAGHRFPWTDSDTISHSRADYYAGVGFTYDESTGGYHPSYSTGGYPYTCPVATFATNGYGLYNMAGNVSEWCWDWYQGSWYTNAAATQADTSGPASGIYRLLRGGNWFRYAKHARCACRASASPGDADYVVGMNHYACYGFRCVRR
jgi:formylglycine-generating enzyme required for sulfatase activity